MRRNNKIRTKIFGLIIAAVLVFSNAAFVPADLRTPVSAKESSVETGITLDSNIQDGLTLHCWNWSYKNIEANMALIASQGYTAIQTSPVQQAKEATKGKPMGNWWVYYQPAAFQIDDTGNSALGTKAEFISMCNTAHEYGIKVIVDVVANHMGNTTSNNLSSAIIADLRNDSDCWHDITRNTSDYSKRYDITQYCMNGVPDLNTANKKVQNYVLNYLKECIDAGADGFRFDAAKHIETPDDTAGSCASDFWPTVINGAVSYAKSSRGIDLYCYGELLDQPDSSGILPVSAYTKYMSVTDNSWGNTLRNNVNSGNAGGFSPFYHKNASASSLVLWAESHDTYANEGSNAVSVQNINKTWALVAARADAMGLYFARPNNMSTQQLGSSSVTGWSYAEVKAVNLFHNAFVGQSEYIDNENGIAYCERGTLGVVLVNCSASSSSVNVTANKIADGTYKDQITGSTFVVSDGRIKGSIGSTGIAVVYNTSASSDTGTTQNQNNVAYIELPASWGDKVYCYAYDSATGTVKNAEWPGAAMTHVSGRIYKYEVPSNIKNPLVIFYSSSTSRYPADMEPGLALKGSMIYQNGGWNIYKEVTDETVTDNKVEQTITALETTTSDTSPSEQDTYPVVNDTTKENIGSTDDTVSDNEKETISAESTQTAEDNNDTSASDDNGNNTEEESQVEEPAETSDEAVKNTIAHTDSVNGTTDGGQKPDTKSFPWAAVIIPAVAAAAGAGVFIFIIWKKKKNS